MRKPSLPRPSLPRPRVPKPRVPRPRISRPVGPPPPSLWSDGAKRAGAAIAVLVIAAIGFGIGYLVFNDPDQKTTAPGPTPVLVEGAPQIDAAQQIGFPTFATRNTTRVGGGDPTADAAGVALASYPTQGGVPGPQAVVIAPADDWAEALAATPLVADPIGAPVLLSDSDSVPDITASALTALAPTGLEDGGEQAITIADATAPNGTKALAIDGQDASEVASEVDAQRARISGIKDPDHLLVVSSSDAAYAMPAAFWAARSGDPILFADGDDVPAATLAVVKRHPDTPIYVLGPESVISQDALKTLSKQGGTVNRVGKEDPVENAIEFARFVDGDFGWNINDPGHGFAIANTDRPLDAVAGSPLAAGGKPGPLLLTDDPDTMPPALTNFLVDTQPGFEDDPTRAVYNHVWILGGEDAISVAFQAQVDDLTKLAPVSGSTATPSFGTGTGPSDATVPPAAGTTTTPGATTTPDTSVPDTSVPDISIPGTSTTPDDSGGKGSGK
jgi:hypothetical protein